MGRACRRGPGVNWSLDVITPHPQSPGLALPDESGVRALLQNRKTTAAARVRAGEVPGTTCKPVRISGVGEISEAE